MSGEQLQDRKPNLSVVPSVSRCFCVSFLERPKKNILTSILKKIGEGYCSFLTAQSFLIAVEMAMAAETQWHRGCVAFPPARDWRHRQVGYKQVCIVFYLFIMYNIYQYIYLYHNITPCVRFGTIDILHGCS